MGSRSATQRGKHEPESLPCPRAELGPPPDAEPALIKNPWSVVEVSWSLYAALFRRVPAEENDKNLINTDFK